MLYIFLINAFGGIKFFESRLHCSMARIMIVLKHFRLAVVKKAIMVMWHG